jgi:glyoxalase family protein
MRPELLGIHHVTAVTADARANLHFYTQILGMRLVKKTVNQDDVSAYHLFYADAKGSPGTDLTFFDWSYSPPQRHGNKSISRTGLRVGGPDSLQWWVERFDKFGIPHGPIRDRAGRSTIDFHDGESQPLMLVDGGNSSDAFPWPGSPVPPEHQICGLGPVTITIPSVRRTGPVLTDILGMRPTIQYNDPESRDFKIQVYEFGPGGAGAELHVRIRPDVELYRPGAGGVHHVAFRVADEESHHLWAKYLKELRVPNSGEVNRFYFRSIYFREPEGILFELATDGPGFAVDEDASQLGTTLALPPFLEPRRAEIEANLISL